MNNHYKFINTPLPYDFQAMEPYIDAETMMLHHDRHLQTYIDNLNNILSQYPQYQGWTLEQLLVNIPSLPEAIQTPVKNNSGGIFNHEFFFSNLLNPAPQKPTAVLADAIEKEFGSFDDFKQIFSAAALSVFGSGYAWLVVDAVGFLKIVTTANQDTTLPLNLCPVLNLDVWEHAYYLKYHNLRKDYIENWFHIINWDNANRNFLRCFDLRTEN